jgi:hypothetical protein
MAGFAHAGGSPENILLIVNPSSPESMYLAGYYKNARNIPDQNVLYIQPTASNNTSVAALYSVASGLNGDLDGFNGFMANAGISNHIDYVVVCNTGAFYTDAPGYMTDSCFPVNRLSQASVYTTAFLKSTILAGNLPSTTASQYFSGDPSQPVAFSSSTLWLGGQPTTGTNGRRYYIGAQLGYTGPLGNNLPELLSMIDLAVACDGTHPAGTYYYMNNTADPVRNIRACGQFSGCAGPTPNYDAAVANLTARGAAASIVLGVLPTGHNDCLGIMTGDAQPAIDTESMTLMPGCFADHLTSWAATYDNSNQTKMSSWIRRGAAGTAGTVEEPCAYPGKFPHQNFHTIYFQGLSLGEAYLRSMTYIPFQSLLYGDPMARPFATLPQVSGNVPSGTASGYLSFTPSASTTLPGASIASLTLYIDGVVQSTHPAGQAFTVDTYALSDGWHELRVLAADSTLVKNTGRWTGSIMVNNTGRSASIGLNTASGDLSTLFSATVSGSGGTVTQLRLLQNGRVIAAGVAGPLSVYGSNLGAGMSRVQVEAQFSDGKTARSAPANVGVAYSSGAPSGLAPVAYSYTKRVARGGPFVVELPARYDDATSGATYTIVSPPSQGTTIGPGSGCTRTMTAAANACGPDQFTFRVTTPSGQSNLGTVTLVYGSGPGCPADMFPDGSLNVIDFSAFLNAFASGDLRADMDGNCVLNVLDFGGFLNAFAAGCP